MFAILLGLTREVCLAEDINTLQNLNPQTSVLSSTSVKNYFIMESMVPKSMWFQFDRDAHFVTLNNAYMSQWTAVANDRPIMARQMSACSGYDSSVCQNINAFYKPKTPEFIVTGLYKLNGDNILSFGANSGFDSEKLRISPSFMLGAATRYYLNDKKDSHLILEGQYWLGSSVSHKPCLDSFDRQYFCGNLTAWSDFNYNPHPESYTFKLWFEKVF